MQPESSLHPRSCCCRSKPRSVAISLGVTTVTFGWRRTSAMTASAMAAPVFSGTPSPASMAVTATLVSPASRIVATRHGSTAAHDTALRPAAVVGRAEVATQRLVLPLPPAPFRRLQCARMRRVPAWLVVVAAVGAGAFIGWLLRPSDSSRSVAVGRPRRAARAHRPAGRACLRHGRRADAARAAGAHPRGGRSGPAGSGGDGVRHLAGGFAPERAGAAGRGALRRRRRCAGARGGVRRSGAVLLRGAGALGSVRHAEGNVPSPWPRVGPRSPSPCASRRGCAACGWRALGSDAERASAAVGRLCPTGARDGGARVPVGYVAVSLDPDGNRLQPQAGRSTGPRR